MLLVHEAEGFRDQGVSVMLNYNPTSSTPLEPTARVAPSWGGGPRELIAEIAASGGGGVQPSNRGSFAGTVDSGATPPGEGVSAGEGRPRLDRTSHSSAEYGGNCCGR